MNQPDAFSDEEWDAEIVASRAEDENIEDTLAGIEIFSSLTSTFAVGKKG